MRPAPPPPPLLPAAARRRPPLRLGRPAPPHLRRPLSTRGRYVDTLLAKAIDEYCKQHQQRYEAATGSQEEGGSSTAAEAPIDRRLIDLVDRMVESSLERRAYQMVMGLALEARRTDLIERIILLCDAKPGELEHDASTIKMLEYCFGLFSSAVVPRSFRATLIALLVTIYRGLPAPEYLGLARCLAQAGDAAGVAAILSQLIESESAEARLAAFQISFDLVDNCTQAFLKLVAERTKAKPPPPAAAEPSAAEGAAEGEAAAAPPPPAEVVEPAASKAHANLQLILSGEASIGCAPRASLHTAAPPSRQPTPPAARALWALWALAAASTQRRRAVTPRPRPRPSRAPPAGRAPSSECLPISHHISPYLPISRAPPAG